MAEEETAFQRKKRLEEEEMTVYDSLFLYCFCREYGLNPKVGAILNEQKLFTSEELVKFQKSDIEELPTSHFFKMLLIGAFGHYRIRREQVDESISRRCRFSERRFKRANGLALPDVHEEEHGLARSYANKLLSAKQRREAAPDTETREREAAAAAWSDQDDEENKLERKKSKKKKKKHDKEEDDDEEKKKKKKKKKKSKSEDGDESSHKKKKHKDKDKDGGDERKHKKKKKKRESED